VYPHRSVLPEDEVGEGAARVDSHEIH
jgi:hypothetical protein